MNTLTISLVVICATLAYTSALPANLLEQISEEVPADKLAATEPEGLEAQESRGWGGGGHYGHHWGGGGHHGHHWGGGGHHGHHWGGRGGGHYWG